MGALLRELGHAVIAIGIGLAGWMTAHLPTVATEIKVAPAVIRPDRRSRR
jgi:hypothetical protein